MNEEHLDTLSKIFTKPAPSDLPWEEIESLLEAVGVRLLQRPGSRLALVMKDEVMVVRRPHPIPLAVKATVKDVAAFLKTVGVRP